MVYEGMSDFEVNKMVAERLDLNDGEEGFFELLPQLVPDFCNNPEHSWGIISENMINLVAPNVGCKWRVFVNVYTGSGSKVSDHFCYDKNGLRAAMLCFLKMKDAEDVNKRSK